MKKIILFNPQPRGYKGEERNYLIPPLSLLGVASGIVELPYEIIIVDEVLMPDYKEKLKSLLPDILCVGVTSMTGYQIKRGLEFSQYIKDNNKNIPVIWGGYHPSSLPEQTVSDPRIDIAVIGQGQITFKELVLAIENKQDFRSVDGIVFKSNGNIIKTKERAICDINALPPFPYNLIDIQKYISDPANTGDRVLGYVTSQGCPYNCLFCAELKVTKRRWLAFSPDKIIKDWEMFHKEFGVTQITVYDSDFCVDQKRMQELIKKLIEKNINVSIGFINVRTDQIKNFEDETLNLLAKIKCTTFLIGAESGSDAILKFINKNCTAEDTVIAKKKLSKYGFTPMFSFMFGLGFDSSLNITPKQEFDSILALINKIRAVDDKSIFNIWNYVPYPGAPLTENAIRAGFVLPDTLEKWAEYHYSSVHVPWIPDSYSLKLEMLRNMIFPYTSHQFSTDWDKNYKGNYKLLKKLFHNTLSVIASFRLKYKFFAFPIDYYLFRIWRQRKNTLLGQID